MESIEETLLELQKEIEEGLYIYRSDHFYTHYNYILYKNDHSYTCINPLQFPFEVLIDFILFFSWDNYHQNLHKLFLDHLLHLRKIQHHRTLKHYNQESWEILYLQYLPSFQHHHMIFFLHLKGLQALPLCYHYLILYLHLKCFKIKFRNNAFKSFL